jgi:hypothetical protein
VPKSSALDLTLRRNCGMKVEESYRYLVAHVKIPFRFHIFHGNANIHAVTNPDEEMKPSQLVR